MFQYIWFNNKGVCFKRQTPFLLYPNQSEITFQKDIAIHVVDIPFTKKIFTFASLKTILFFNLKRIKASKDIAHESL